ncbi:dUTPase [Trachipleistophora hominis]|uniref:Deoxyuridine 5'-triphosphate nucleotidohydrolase n=1 Tax=Trachipleistophora hominis TaxID=72359 RepID=L7JXD8_TRAHO|nr:dUTPase [Trachipleistophora hominis]
MLEAPTFSPAMFNLVLSSETAIPPKKNSHSHLLYASETTVINPKTLTTIPTGVYLSFPPDYFLYISSLSHKFGSNAHVIDSDYRGEIFHVVRSKSDESFVVEKGEPVAQLIFYKIVLPEFEVIEN